MMCVVVFRFVDRAFQQFDARVAVAGLAGVSALRFPEPQFALPFAAHRLVRVLHRVDLGFRAVEVAAFDGQHRGEVRGGGFVALAQLADEFIGVGPILQARGHAKPLLAVVITVPLGLCADLFRFAESAIVDQAPRQDFEVMAELMIFVGLHVLLFVVFALQFDRVPRIIGGLRPFADAHPEVRLHVESVR